LRVSTSEIPSLQIMATDFGVASAGTEVIFTSCCDERHGPENIIDGCVDYSARNSSNSTAFLQPDNEFDSPFTQERPNILDHHWLVSSTIYITVCG
jgi:hypothetical protein